LRIDLTQLKHGETGKIVEFAGGSNFIKKIESMGVRPGKSATKVSSHFWRGPQTIKIDRTQIAIGYGMARKIMVEVER